MGRGPGRPPPWLLGGLLDLTRVLALSYSTVPVLSRELRPPPDDDDRMISGLLDRLRFRFSNSFCLWYK